MNAIEARGVGVRIGAATILDGIDLAVAPGTLLGLLGPNGAGKTTLLEVMAGLRRADRGGVRLGDQALAWLDPMERARRIGYLEQGAVCHWPLSVERTVSLGRLPHRGAWGGTSSADAPAIEAAMVACDVAHLRRRDVTTLSGGERARVLFARCLAGHPEALLADEPVAGLDPAHQIRCLELLAARAAAGVAVVVVMHDLALALRFCDRICLLSAGRVAAIATPAELLSGDVIETVYGIELARHSRGGRPYAMPWSLRERNLP
ncbi:iron complex transport system ATP-binding protein [Stella humosa]|uniref:Iron complex transport system ATP-binding protein n=1 Tax=Stella humosa TaxID=94 RepID=A0A3N1MCP6_9PROT|nr:ABC transporter ATP-binding protein [Stella humosa]ROQ01483.1 iron complex transport system ATP-binding protein [Stella humosa]BBK31861.1 ABC transporter [Stella humosa]